MPGIAVSPWEHERKAGASCSVALDITHNCLYNDSALLQE